MEHPSRIRQLLVGISVASILAVPVQGGFIDLLRGEPDPVVAQRVAFFGSAVVKRVDGSVERLTGIDKWEPVKAGTTLRTGDLVRTKEGTILLRMVESQSFVRVTPNTILRLAAAESESDRSILSGCEERRGYVVRSCRGPAFSRLPGGEWKPIQVNTVLPESCAVRTETGVLMDLFHTESKRALRIPGSTEIDLPAVPRPEIALARPRLSGAGGR